MRVVTATYDGESVSFAPHVVYSPEEGGPLYVDVVFTDAPTVGNRPPALAALEVALLASPALTATEFALHPRLAPVLRRYQNVKCIVQAS
jgi:hypothetical protein